MGLKPKSFEKGNVMSTNEELAVRNGKKLQEDCRYYNPESHKIIDVDCTFENGKFVMTLLPGMLPSLFTIRFTTPVDYTAGDVVVVKDKELPVRTPGMAAATSDIFKAGAVIHCDIDMDRELAFLTAGNIQWTSGSDIIYSYDGAPTGKRWVDGRMIFHKTFKFPGLRQGVDHILSHGIENFDFIIQGYGMAFSLTGDGRPLLYRDGLIWFIKSQTEIGVGGINNSAHQLYSMYTEVYLTIEYVCKE